jgi:uncharacterized membrane protein YccF (DUF307 family)
LPLERRARVWDKRPSGAQVETRDPSPGGRRREAGARASNQEGLMSLIGNILWIVLGGGIVLFLEYLIAGLLLCLTIIGIPFGVQAIKLAGLALVPFGREVVRTPNPPGCLSVVMNVLWILVGGIWISITHVVFALLCAITIIGIPFAKQHMKLAALALTPFGATVR